MPMAIIVKRSDKKDLAKVSCSGCGERVHGIGLEKGSRIVGLCFKCKKCGLFNEVKTTDEREPIPF
jgi:predicted RNA-binding Zn-ribbon protein involved in translation (DUF1610 family)